MRSLILFIFKYHFIFLFLILETICFLFIARSGFFQRASLVTTSNVVSGQLFSSVNAVEEYFSLKYTNRLLSEENARLRNRMMESYLNPDNTLYLNPTDSIERHYEYVPVKVVNNTVNRQKNYITINKGAKYGIQPDMAVVSTNGIVGIVIDVSENFSSVISLLHLDAKVSAKILKNDYFGSLTWDGNDKNFAVFSDISTYVTIEQGDTIVTSGLSTVFPEGIMIGTIYDFFVPEGENFYRIRIKLSTDFSNLSFAYVIKNYLQLEQNDMEVGRF